MSMLSAQCDELRQMAESVGLAMPQAATLMMEAADTIWELRCKCAGMVDMRERARLAETENAKLREGIDASHMSRLLTENENESLRELVRLMWKPFCWEQSGCEVCLTDEQDAEIRDKVRELGVEVDDAS